jgi:hypothetical protein
MDAQTNSATPLSYTAQATMLEKQNACTA